MTIDEMNKLIKTLQNTKTRSRCKIYFGLNEDNGKIPSDATLKNWGKGVTKPSYEATILLQKFFEQDQSESMSQ